MIKLVAIDLDGTLFNSKSEITEENKKAIKRLYDAGLHPVISTGRPFDGIPEILKSEIPFTYAITANGAGVYEIASSRCIYQDPMDSSITLPILEYLSTKDLHVDAFIEGHGYSTYKALENGYRLQVPDGLKHYILNARTRVESLSDFIITENKNVQKMTLNFYNDADGKVIDRPEVKAYLECNKEVDVVCGGYNNLEFTKAGVNKGLGLLKLSQHLGLSIDETMAIGDTENDESILRACGTAVAMGNAIPSIKEVADFVTLDNDMSGVAHAILKYCFS